MKIGVIIPAVQIDMYYALMDTISNNTVHPDYIVTIDNSNLGVKDITIPNVNHTLIRNAPKEHNKGNFVPGAGTNEAWKNHDYFHSISVPILNK